MKNPKMILVLVVLLLSVSFDDITHANEFSHEEPPAIRLDFTNTDIKHVLRLMAEVGRINIIWGPNVAGPISFKTKKKPFYQVLDELLRSNGFTYRIDNGVCYVNKLEARKIYSDRNGEEYGWWIDEKGHKHLFGRKDTPKKEDKPKRDRADFHEKREVKKHAKSDIPTRAFTKLFRVIENVDYGLSHKKGIDESELPELFARLMVQARKANFKTTDAVSNLNARERRAAEEIIEKSHDKAVQLIKKMARSWGCCHVSFKLKRNATNAPPLCGPNICCFGGYGRYWRQGFIRCNKKSYFRNLFEWYDIEDHSSDLTR